LQLRLVPGVGERGERVGLGVVDGDLVLFVVDVVVGVAVAQCLEGVLFVGSPTAISFAPAGSA
jgi:hypothetical protein